MPQLSLEANVPTAAPSPEQAVIVHLKLTSAMGTPAEVEAARALSDSLDRAIRAAGAGEFDGDEFGDGECALYMYGPSADALFDAIRGVLQKSALTRGGWVLKRFGRAGDPAAREEKLQL
jgi:hypothetical protein